MLEDPFPMVRTASSVALWRVGAWGEKPLRVLQNAVDSDNDASRIAGIKAIGEVGKGALSLLPQLCRCATGGSSDVREFAVATLAAFEDDMAVRTLLVCLSDDEWRVRWKAAQALAVLGPKAAQAIPQLAATLKDNNWMVRAASAEALGAMGPAARGVRDQLESLLRDPVEEVRAAGRGALSNLGE
jgi:HEAT repeat protein